MSLYIKMLLKYSVFNLIHNFHERLSVVSDIINIFSAVATNKERW